MPWIRIRNGGFEPAVRLGQSAHVGLHARDFAAVPEKINGAVIILKQGRVNFIAHAFLRLHVLVRTFRLAGGALEQTGAGGFAGAVINKEIIEEMF